MVPFLAFQLTRGSSMQNAIVYSVFCVLVKQIWVASACWTGDWKASWIRSTWTIFFVFVDCSCQRPAKALEATRGAPKRIHHRMVVCKSILGWAVGRGTTKMSRWYTQGNAWQYVNWFLELSNGKLLSLVQKSIWATQTGSSAVHHMMWTAWHCPPQLKPCAFRKTILDLLLNKTDFVVTWCRSAGGSHRQFDGTQWTRVHLVFPFVQPHPAMNCTCRTLD